MRNLLDQIETWLNNDQSVALATVIKTWGSSPRPVGAGMAVSAEGQIIGSVSGGCVEGAVIEEKPVMNEQMDKMKHLLGYKPESYVSTKGVKNNRKF